MREFRKNLFALAAFVLMCCLTVQVAAAQNTYVFTGSLKDEDGQGVEALITVYEEGTDNPVDSIQTTNGHYEITVPSGKYDIEYSIQDIFIPGFWVKIKSVSIGSNVTNLLEKVTGYPESERVEFRINSTTNSEIETFSAVKPADVIIDGASARQADSSSDLTNEAWFFEPIPNRLHIRSSAGLVAHYDFEVVGSIVDDRSGFQNDAQVIGAVYVDGVRDSAMAFDGDDYLETPDSSALDIDEEVTIMAWISPSSISQYDRIIAKSHTEDLNPWTMYGLLFDAGNHSRMEISTDENQNFLNGVSTIPLNQWTHLAATYDGSEMRLFVNGNLDASTAHTGPIDINDMPLTVARSGFGSNYFKGEIDDVRVYNRALAGQKIRQSFEESPPPGEPEIPEPPIEPEEPALAPLHVEGNKIVDPQGNEVILRGLTYIDQGHNNRGDNVDNDFRIAAQEWKANVMRMPVHPVTYSGNPESYFTRFLDPQIEAAEKYGMYVSIDYHAYDEQDLAALQEFWGLVAPRYADKDFILYEIMNEPTKGDWGIWRQNVETITDLIRSYDPDAVIIMNGLSWGYVISYALDDPVQRDNIVYGSHPYPVKLDSCRPSCTVEQSYSNWDYRFGSVKERYPVIATEFGWLNDGNYVWGDTNEHYGYRILDYFDERGIGYFAWHWSPSYAPQLCTDWNFNPSYSGAVIKAHLNEKN